jgi:predicted nucleic acid-binding protein
MTLIADASVAVKWLVEERDSRAAQRLLDSDDPLVAPDFVLVEVGDVLWKKTRRHELNPEQAVAGMRAAPTYFDELIPCGPLLARALAIAVEVRHPVYDCLYLACAEDLEMTLVAADGRFASVARAGFSGARVIPLSDLGDARS